MTGFKIYVPNARGYGNHCEKVGVGRMSVDIAPQWEGINQGPDGGSGQIGFWPTPDPEQNPPEGMPPGYEWWQSPPEGDQPKGAYWVGYNPQNPPGPIHFQRVKVLPGTDITLGDKRAWTIPSAQAIPQRYGIDMETGQKEIQIDPKYQNFCKTAYLYASEFYQREQDFKILKKMFAGVELNRHEEEYVDLQIPTWAGRADATKENTRLEEIEYKLELDDCIDHSFEALQLNYRLTPAFVSQLGLLDRDTVLQIVLATIDFQKINYHIKKKEQGLEISLPSGYLT